jgi:tetratricopeptide (TPR) repeat protein
VDQSYEKEFPSSPPPVVGPQAVQAGDLILEALASYEVLEREDWIAALKQNVLGKNQVEQIRHAVYEELLRLATSGFWDHLRWGQFSPELAARRALFYLEKAEKAHAPTVALYRIRATCHKALGHENAARADQDLISRTPPTMAIDCYLEAQAALSGIPPNYTAAIKALDEGLRLEPAHFWSMMKLGHCLSYQGHRPDDTSQVVRIFGACIMKRPDYALARPRNRLLKPESVA